MESLLVSWSFRMASGFYYQGMVNGSKSFAQDAIAIYFQEKFWGCNSTTVRLELLGRAHYALIGNIFLAVNHSQTVGTYVAIWNCMFHMDLHRSAGYSNGDGEMWFFWHACIEVWPFFFQSKMLARTYFWNICEQSIGGVPTCRPSAPAPTTHETHKGFVFVWIDRDQQAFLMGWRHRCSFDRFTYDGTWYAGFEGYPVRRWNQVRDSVDIAPPGLWVKVISPYIGRGAMSTKSCAEFYWCTKFPSKPVYQVQTYVMWYKQNASSPSD